MNLICKLLNTALLGALLLPVALKAQTVSEASIKVGKDHKSGFVAISKYGKSEVADILATKFEEAGLKKHSKKSKFITFKGVTWPVTGRNKVDIRYRVTVKKHQTKVSFVASKGYDNYITAATDASGAAAVTSFLTQLDAAIAHNEELKQKEKDLANLDNSIEKQKADLKKAEEAKTKKTIELQKMQKNDTY